MYNEQDFLKMLDVLYRSVSATRSQNHADPRLKDAEHLATKFLVHGASTLYLTRGTHLHDFPTLKLGFVDTSSVDVIARSAFETFLVFHHIFIAPGEEAERQYRYLSWKVAGLAERQHFTPAIQDHHDKLTSEKKELHDLHARLCANSFFKMQVNDEHKDRVMKGEWKLKSWREIAQSAGLTRVLCLDMYRYLCEYAHAGFLSAAEIEHALHKTEQPHLMEPAMITITIATANILHEYCQLFPEAKSILIADVPGHEIVVKWVGIGRRL